MLFWTDRHTSILDYGVDTSVKHFTTLKVFIVFSVKLKILKDFNQIEGF